MSLENAWENMWAVWTGVKVRVAGCRAQLKLQGLRVVSPLGYADQRHIQGAFGLAVVSVLVRLNESRHSDEWLDAVVECHVKCAELASGCERP